MLAVVQTHPVPYHAPVFRLLHQRFAVPLQVIYASDFSLAGYRDADFGVTVAWDTDLLAGYPSQFVSRVAQGGARSFEEVSSRGVAALLSRLRPSAVLVCGYRPHIHRAAFLRAWRSGYPILFRGETVDTEPAGPAVRALRRVALRMLYARCARLLYIGTRSRRHFEALGFDDKQLVFSPYCSDTSAFAADESARLRMRVSARCSLDVQPDDVLLLFSGKLTPKKRPDLLVEALRRLQSRSSRRFVAVFVGGGELRGQLEAETRRAPAISVRFTGFKNQTELSPYYHAADLLVLPSQHSETWGVVVNEALCHGVPCVVSDAVGCAADLIKPGQTGEVFAVGSVEALEAAIIARIGADRRRRRAGGLSPGGRRIQRRGCGGGHRPRLPLHYRRRDLLTTTTPRATSDPSIVIVGNPGESHIGRHLDHAARTLNVPAVLCDVTRADAGSRAVRLANWHLRGRRPARLSEFSRHVLDVCRAVRPTHLLATGLAPVDQPTLHAIGELGVRRINFLTDDPWNAVHSAPWFLRAVGEYDVVFSPRTANLADLRAAGCREVEYLPFAYAPDMHFSDPPRSPGESARFASDLVFIGGADRDRVEWLSPLIAAGFSVALYGGYWDRFIRTRSEARGMADSWTVRKAIGGAAVALCLVRHANRDGHSMRTFEVPAIGACMLVEDTAEHRVIFGDSRAAVEYVTSPRDAINRLRALLAEESERQRLKAHVHHLVRSHAHTWSDRLKTMVGDLGAL